MEGPIRNTPMSASGHLKHSQGDASEDKLSNSHESASGLHKLAQGDASAVKLSNSHTTVPTSDSIESLVDDDHIDGCGFKKNIMLKWRKNLMFNINNLGCATFGNSYKICGHIMEQNYKKPEILSLQQDAVASVKTTPDRHTQQKVSTYEVVTYESINRARKDIRRLLLKLGRDFTYTYNASEHGFIVRAKGIKLVFKLPPFSNRLDSSDSSIKIDTSRRWFHVHNYDNYAYNLTHRHTQGLTMLATYTAEAVTAAAGAFSIYQGYKWYSDIKTTLLGGGWSVESILKRLQLEATDVVFALVNIASCIKGDITVSQLMLILAGYAVGKQMFKKFLELANNVIFQLVSADSSTRHTQGADPTTFAHGVISLIGVYFLGTTTEPTTAKSILTSIKTLGSTLLTVKTVEQVLIAIINSLPDVIFAFLCQRFPALGLYTMIHDDKEFKKYVEISTRLKNTRLLDVLYNSHNFHEFLKYHKYTSDVILRVENLERGVHYLLTELVDWYDTVYEVADKLGLLPGKRHLPYVLWLSGHPGIGKSTLAKEIATMMARRLVSVIPPDQITEEDVQNLIFSYSTSNEFFDGYHNQPIFILNDYLQFAKDEEEKWLIKFVDTMELQLPVSTVDNIDQGIKGEVRFCSRFIIVTSNATYLNSSNNIISTDAFNRRRDYVCEMVWKEKMATVDFDQFNYSWARFNRLVPHTYGSIQVLNDRSDPIYRTLEKDSFIENLLFSYEAFLKRSARVTDLTYSEKTVLKANLKTSISLFDQAKSYFDTVVNRLEVALKKAWDYEILGIPLRYIMGLFIAGTGLYLGYKTIAGYITGRIAQSMSGDVSTKRFAPDRKPLQRVTMGVSSDVSQMAVHLRDNMGQITTTLSADRIFTQTMWGVHLGGTLFLTPKHTWFRGEAQIAKGEIFIIEFKGVRYQIPFDPAYLYTDPSRDLAVYNVFGYIPVVRSIRGYLPRDSTSISVNGEKAFLVVPTQESLLLHSTVAYVKNVNYTDPLGKVYGNIDLWQYDIRTIIGDCGSPLIIRGSGLGTYFAGIHVAGDTYSGNAEIITKEFLENVEDYFTRQGANNKVTQGYMTDAVVEEVYEDAQSDFDEGFLFLGRAKTAPWAADKTEIIKGPLYEVLQPHTSEPAVLSPSDPRLVEPCSPILKSVAKYATPVRPFKKDLMDEAFKIVKHFYDPLMMHTGRVHSYDDAINSTYTPHLQKIDLNTSAGYPWNTKQLKKKDLIDRLPDGNLRIRQVLLDRLNMSDTCLRKNTMFPYTLTTTLKDERVSLSKVAIGKTRTFMNFPIEYTILMRKYFDDFINYETEHAFEIGTTIGVNIYSTQWDRLHSLLSKFEYHLDGDFKAFDGTIRPEFFTYYARLVNRFYNDGHANIRKLLMHGCCFAPIFVLDKVYMKMQGNPSGSRVTTSFNSFVNRMYVVMSILEVLPSAYWNVEFFTKNIKIFAHGDDHLIGFSKLLHSYWGGFALRDFMTAHGIEYTSSKKDQPLVNTCPLDECFYLKSHFVFDVATRRYKCGLQKEVIQEMVSWQRDTTYETTQMIVDTALRYAYFWGREYFNTISMSLKMACKLKRLPLRFIPYDDLENEYTWKEQLTFSYVNQ